jgi:molybdopterin synthase catalytic subunit
VVVNVRVRLFAALRERAGTRELSLDVADGASVDDVLEAMAELTLGVPVVMAVNREYADGSRVLKAGDELALIPPVSGGALELIVDGPLSLDALVEQVRDPRAGAVVTFSGVTRDVPQLDYEAYAEMAAPVIEEIVRDAIARHGLCAAAAQHRVGVVPLSEPSVIVAASAPHRGEAFAGAREIIDAIKDRAPIWKKEEGEWVEGSVPS